MAFIIDQYTEELLEEHDAELAKVKAYYEENKILLDKIGHRQKLWLDFLEFEVWHILWNTLNVKMF